MAHWVWLLLNHKNSDACSVIHDNSDTRANFDRRTLPFTATPLSAAARAASGVAKYTLAYPVNRSSSNSSDTPVAAGNVFLMVASVVLSGHPAVSNVRVRSFWSVFSWAVWFGPGVDVVVFCPANFINHVTFGDKKMASVRGEKKPP